jgi:general nucleoside transport system permease protein
MLGIRLEPRQRASRAAAYLSPVLAVALTLIAGIIMFALLGYNPVVAFEAFFIKPLSSLYEIAEVGVKASPLLLCAIGLAVGFRCNVWNIGAEGQFFMGAVGGSGVALAFPDSNAVWLLPLMLVAGIVAGALWAGIAAFLKTRFNTNEILTTLMLTYVAVLIENYLVHGPWRDPQGYNFPLSREFQDAALLPILVPGTRLNLGVVFALIAVAGVWVLLERSFIGFQIRVVGLGPAAADYAGFSSRRLVWLSLLLSGALAGLAGVDEVAGPIGQLTPSISPGYGFAAIIVAFLGRLHPVGILLASILISLLYLGGESMQVDIGLPVAAVGVFQGMLLFFLLACDLLIRYRVRIGAVQRGTTAA